MEKSNWGCRLGRVPDWTKAYNSPINLDEAIMMSEIVKQCSDRAANSTDDRIYQVVLQYGIKVDKDELIKALEYDRNQFRAGYEAAIRDMHEAAKSVVCGNADVRAVEEASGDDGGTETESYGRGD